MLTGYLRQRRRTLLAFFLFGGIFAAAFALYQLPLRAVAYPFVLCAAAGAVLLTLDYRRVLRQHRRLELLRQLPEELADALPPADTVKEADYRSLVTLLAESRRAPSAPRRSSATATWWTTIPCGPTRSKLPLPPCA